MAETSRGRAADPGVITFNSQQSLIEDLLDQKEARSSGDRMVFCQRAIEPTVIKNLENVQGDERDVMLPGSPLPTIMPAS
ncbi:hypothetical protein ACOJBO_02105 [Rhizobium beringeri]